MKALSSDPMQPMLFDALPPIVKTKAAKRETIREQFERFHAANPHVYLRLRDISLSMRRRGVKQWGARAAWEILRYQGIATNSAEGYKLPNVCVPHYARLLMAQEPELAGFFKTCALRRE